VGATIPIAHAGGNQSLPVVASDGSDYLVAWRDDKLGGTDVFAARVSGAGAVIDTSSFMVFDAMGAVSDGPQPPAAAFDGTSYVVAWPSISSSQPTFGRVKPADASLLDGNGKTIKTQGGGPLALTRSATYTGLVFGYTAASNLAVRIDGTGNVLDAQPVPVPAGSFSLPAVSKAGVLMTTWQVYPTPPYDAFRVKANQVGL